MPIYAYKCLKCEAEFESIMKPYEDASGLIECPECKCRTGERQVSAHGGYHIKGNNGASVRPKGAGHNGKK